MKKILKKILEKRTTSSKFWGLGSPTVGLINIILHRYELQNLYHHNYGHNSGNCNLKYWVRSNKPDIIVTVGLASSIDTYKEI